MALEVSRPQRAVYASQGCPARHRGTPRCRRPPTHRGSSPVDHEDRSVVRPRRARPRRSGHPGMVHSGKRVGTQFARRCCAACSNDRTSTRSLPCTDALDTLSATMFADSRSLFEVPEGPPLGGPSFVLDPGAGFEPAYLRWTDSFGHECAQLRQCSAMHPDQPVPPRRPPSWHSERRR